MHDAGSMSISYPPTIDVHLERISISKKHLMGASVKQVSPEELPTASHAFARIDGRKFNVRAPQYEK
jgi:hypothetical protein